MAKGLARGDLDAGRVAHFDAARDLRDRRRELADSPRRDAGSGLRLADLVQRLLQPRRLDRLAVPAEGTLEEGHALALHGARENRRRTAFACALERAQHSVQVVAVDLDGAPAEGLEAAREDRAVVAVRRRPRLPEAVDVDDRDEVRQLIERGELRRLPHRSLGALAVAHQAVDPRVDAVEPV